MELERGCSVGAWRRLIVAAAAAVAAVARAIAVVRVVAGRVSFAAGAGVDADISGRDVVVEAIVDVVVVALLNHGGMARVDRPDRVADGRRGDDERGGHDEADEQTPRIES